MLAKLIELLTNYFVPMNNKISLISTYSQIETLKFDNEKLLAFLYSNKEILHQILYDNDQLIKLPSEIADKGITNLFYIILLIKCQSELVNYFYELNLIKKVNNLRKQSDDSLTIFVFSIIILQLIANYKQTDMYEEESDDETLNELYKENEKIKNESKSILKSMNLNISEENIENNMLSEIYVEIIKSLIDNKKLDDYNYCSKIFEKISLDKIELTDNMINDLLTIFSNNEEYINKYNFSNEDDLMNENKMDFYMTIFKYILKDSIYIYNFQFLLSAREAIIKMLKSESNTKLREIINDNNDSNSNNNLKEKLSFIINKFCDSEYITNKYLSKTSNQKLREVLNYYQNFYFKRKESEISIIEKYLENKNNLAEEELNKYLKDYDEAQKINERKEIIYFFFKERIGKILKDQKTQKEMEKCIKKIKDCENMIKNKKFSKKMRKDDKKTFCRYFHQNNNNKIFTQEESENFMKEMIDEKINYQESNLLKGMEEYKDEPKSLSTDDTEDKIEKIKNITKIGQHQKSAESIIQTKQGDFISMDENKISVYNERYDKIIDIKNKENSGKYTEIQEVPNTEGKNEIEIIACAENELSMIKIDKETGRTHHNKSNIYKITPKSCLSIDDRNQTHIIFSEQGVYHIENLFNEIMKIRTFKSSDNNCIGGIKINKNLIAITSNKNIPNGKDSIQFYNPSLGEIVQEIEGYSFTNTNHNLTLFSSRNNDNNSTLLCACRKNENENQKNGILLVNTSKIMNNNDINNESIKFIETGFFEVYSFCPLYTRDNKKTDYILVGGYNQENNLGEIKLYKFSCDKNGDKMDIKFMLNLDYDKENNNNFKEFNGAIKCIIQSNDKQNILITCSDGNVYYFPIFDFDLDESLKKEEKIDMLLLKELANIKS